MLLQSLLTGRTFVSRSHRLSQTSWCTRKFTRSLIQRTNESSAEHGQKGEGGESTSAETKLHPSTSHSATGGFVKAMAKLEGHESFPKTIRNCPLIQMGDPQGKIVEGTIVHVVEDDLYIDFGTKFNCVCPRPQKNGSVYTLGKKVRVMVHDLELSTRFLGAKTDLTILEADCSLLGLARIEKS